MQHLRKPGFVALLTTQNNCLNSNFCYIIFWTCSAHVCFANVLAVYSLFYCKWLLQNVHNIRRKCDCFECWRIWNHFTHTYLLRSFRFLLLLLLLIFDLSGQHKQNKFVVGQGKINTDCKCWSVRKSGADVWR